MMLKSWSSIEKVPYCFSRSSVKFQGHKEQISLILSGIECFRTVTPVWIHRWLWNDLHSLKWHRRGALMFVKVIHQISRSHRTENANFEPNWAFLDCNCSLNSLMTNGIEMRHKAWCSTEEVPYCFSQGHPSNLKLTWTEKSMIWIQF